MNIMTRFVGLCVLFFAPQITSTEPLAENPAQPSSPLRVLVLSGGHNFETEPFYDMFASFDIFEIDHDQMDETCTTFDVIDTWDYDVIVFYHFRRQISEKSRQNLLKLCENGVGIVVLHHAIAGFPDWSEWRKIVGAKYFLEDTAEDGTLYKRCKYKHDVVFNVKVKKAKHPVCRTIHDETYKGYRLEPKNNILLTTTEPLSQRELGWTRKYKKTRVVYLQLGHDHYAFENPNYRKLLKQSIHWTDENEPAD